MLITTRQIERAKKGTIRPSGEKEKLEYCLDCYLYNKPLMEERMERERKMNLTLIPYQWFWFYNEKDEITYSKKLITLQGITTSQIRKREKLSDTPAYCFLRTEGQEQDIPIIFRIKGKPVDRNIISNKW